VEVCPKCGRRAHDRAARCRYCYAVLPVGPCRHRLGTVIGGAIIAVRTTDTRIIEGPMLEQKCERCQRFVLFRQLMTAAQAAA
jgi:hypothetical protein